MDELRIEIWDLLYHSAEPISIEEIAQRIDQEEATVQDAVDHEWFQVSDGIVAISRDAPQS